jgi:N-acetylmuramoyl-L-alanine amidase
MEDYRALLETYPKSSLADDAALALARGTSSAISRTPHARCSSAQSQLPKGDQTARLKALAASLPPESKDSGKKAAGKGEAILPRRDDPAASPRPSAADPDRRPRRRLPALTITQAPPRPVETPDWLKEVTTPKTLPDDGDSGGETSPDGDDEDASEPAAERSSGHGTSPGRRVRAPAARRTPRSADAGAILALAPPTQVRERLRAIKKRAPSEVTLAEQLGLKFRRVVVDPGHGGHDTGTIGAGGAREKDVALAIAKKLRTVLTEQGLEVVLTRETDKFVRLEERARLANVARGDLFISIHCNSLPQRHIRGIETYTLNLASDRYAIRLAARENASSEKGMSDLQFLLADLATRANTEESVRLATQVQSGLVSSLAEARTPSSATSVRRRRFASTSSSGRRCRHLVETGSSPIAEEESSLDSPSYREMFARAIASGVQASSGTADRLRRRTDPTRTGGPLLPGGPGLPDDRLHSTLVRTCGPSGVHRLPTRCPPRPIAVCSQALIASVPSLPGEGGPRRAAPGASRGPPLDRIRTFHAGGGAGLSTARLVTAAGGRGAGGALGRARAGTQAPGRGPRRRRLGPAAGR